MVKKLPKAPPLMAAILLWTLSCAMAGAQTIDPTTRHWEQYIRNWTA